MKIISLHGGHDSAITALENGQIIWHGELERILNSKHFCNFDHTNEIADVLYNHALPTLGWKESDIDILVFGDDSCWRKTEFNGKVPQYTKGNTVQPWAKGRIKLRGGHEVDCYAIEHHINHAAYAYFTSPWQSSTLIYTHDGFGDNTASIVCIGYDNKLDYIYNMVSNPIPDIKPNAIGLTYSYLGRVFPFLRKKDGGEDLLGTAGRFMGLSSYGKPRNEWRTECRKILNEWMPRPEALPEKLGIDKVNLNDPMNKVAQDLAATIQDEAELYILETVRQLQKLTDLKDNLCIVGGCALNVQINSRLLQEGVIKNLWAPPACSDTGISIGSALYCWHVILDEPRLKEHDITDQGTIISVHNNGDAFTIESPKQEILTLEKEKITKLHKPNLGDTVYNVPPSSLEGKEFADFNKLMAEKYPMINYELVHMDITGETSPIEKRIAQDIKDGLIVGVRQGRQEIGPRALGFSSIYADPSIASMKDKINLKVKHREVWRPYAGCCLQEDVENYFFCDRESPSLLYMLEAPQAKPHTKDIMPAIIHTDNTCRIQVVTKQSNKHLFNLLTEFKKIGGCDAILLTSFNGPGQPIINNFYDALNLLRDTNLDVVYIEEWRFTKK